MILLIDNLDGLGPVDYSAAVVNASAHPTESFRIVRVLNAPSVLKGSLCLEGASASGSGLKVPLRQARVAVNSDSGTVLFTGYLTTEPVAVYAGVASEGAVYRLVFSAVSDEWLLDKQSAGSPLGAALGSPGGALVTALVNRVGGTRLTTGGATSARAVGVFEPEADATFSVHAGAVGGSTYAAYRALNGAVSVVPAGSVTHALSDGDGSLQLAGFSSAKVRELANDVTVSGAMEPAAYWTEIFQGDGTTTQFVLTGEAAVPNAGKSTLISDDFNAGLINRQVWSITDPGSHLGLSSAGLTLGGGNGFDGGTQLVANDSLELGGTCVLELGGVVLGAGSAGVVAGLYSGVTLVVNCVAGFNVRQSGGQTLLTPMVNGAEVGTSLTVAPGHRYTLRLRVHSREVARVKQAFYALSDASGSPVVTQFGGGLLDAPLALVFEARDEGASSNTPVTVLYDGSLPSSPAQARVVAVNSVQLFGSVASVRLERTGSAWVQSKDATTGTVRTRLVGKGGQGIDCTIGAGALGTVTGSVTFQAGRVPAAGETVLVTYRGRRRSVARVANSASVAQEAAGGGVGRARWVGHVLRPVARSAEDCENAAAALLSVASNRSAAVAGSYVTVNPPGDLWPGDLLAIAAGGSNTYVVVRKVEIEEHGAAPEALLFRIAFANDWAESLGIKVSERISKDALLPARPLDSAASGPGGLTGHVLGNLPQLTVVAVNASAIQLDAGAPPPAGGGFEVRRRDGGFGTGASGNGDLVLQSPVRGFSIPRGAFEETFFVRTYDGSTPPLYSRESAAVVTHWAVG